MIAIASSAVRGSLHPIILAALITGTPAFAQETSEMVLDVGFLAAPTEWCTASNGVPMTVTMDGPEIIRGPEDFPRKVKVRRGGDVMIADGENIASFNDADDVLGKSAEVIGRFSANFEACVSAFSDSSANGSWTLTGLDGAILETGAIDSNPLSLPLATPFFRPMSGPPESYFARFGDRVLFTAGRPEAKTKQTFLAQPDKE